MFKKAAVILLLLCLALGLSAQTDTLRILCIGNSFSINAVEQNLVELAAEKGVTLKIGNMYIGGCSLERHATNYAKAAPDYSFRIITASGREVIDKVSMQQAFAYDDWDIVTVQQASHFSGIWGSYEPWLTQLLDIVHDNVRPDTKIFWYQTWAYATTTKHKFFEPNYHRDQLYMYDQIVRCTYQVLLAHTFDGLIPCGTAAQYVRQTPLGEPTGKDGYHMKKMGCYLLACTWLESITGISSIGCTFRPEEIDDDQRDYIQHLAHEAVINPLY